MAQSLSPKNDSDPGLTRSQYSRMNGLDVEVIRVLTPIFIATIGGVIGITVLVINPDNGPGLGLAGSAIAGAADLAQPNKES